MSRQHAISFIFSRQMSRHMSGHFRLHLDISCHRRGLNRLRHTSVFFVCELTHLRVCTPDIRVYSILLRPRERRPPGSNMGIDPRLCVSAPDPSRLQSSASCPTTWSVAHAPESGIANSDDFPRPTGCSKYKLHLAPWACCMRIWPGCRGVR